MLPRFISKIFFKIKDVYGKFLRRPGVYVDGVGTTYSGEYYVDGVKHSFSNKDYKQEIKLDRNATGNDPGSDED